MRQGPQEAPLHIRPPEDGEKSRFQLEEEGTARERKEAAKK
jgi:hypothetical protein